MEKKNERDSNQTKAISEHGPLTSDDVRSGFIQGVTFRQPKLVKFAVVDGKAIFEGDMVLGYVDQMIERGRESPHVSAKDVQRGIGITGTRYRWPNSIIPYEIDPNLQNKQRVTDALNHWHAMTRIRFIERTAQNAPAFPNYLVLHPDPTGCWSMVGMLGSGKQEIGLAGGCLRGQAIHELGHTVGLFHEQSREDRNNFVKIHPENIDPTKLHNFDQQITDGDDYGPFDYGSIMHYGAYDFTSNGRVTIEVLTPGATIGQRNGLSPGDTSAVYIIYWHRNGQHALDAPSVFQNCAPNNYNYELVVPEGGHLQHYWFDLGGQNVWNKGASFGNYVGFPTMFQNHAPGNYNYELVVQEGDHLQHYWFDWRVWNKGASFGANVQGPPAVFQNDADYNRNYELVVPEGGHLQHYWFDYGGQNVWNKEASFGSNVVGSPPAMFQNHAFNNNNYEVCVREGSHLQ
ncbi:MAG: M12 family metallopeptidase, partial [Halobacteriota archaeon]